MTEETMSKHNVIIKPGGADKLEDPEIYWMEILVTMAA